MVAVVLELTSSANCELCILAVHSGTRTLVGNTLHKTGGEMVSQASRKLLQEWFLQLFTTVLHEELGSLLCPLLATGVARQVDDVAHLDDDGVNGGLHACEQGRGSDESTHIDTGNSRCFSKRSRGVVGVGKSLGWLAENQGQGAFGGRLAKQYMD